MNGHLSAFQVLYKQSWLIIREIPQQTNVISMHRTLLRIESSQSTYFRHVITNATWKYKNNTSRKEYNIFQDRHLGIVENEIWNETGAEKSNKAQVLLIGKYTTYHIHF